MTSEKMEMDRSVFRDLLHGSLGMTDDFFMDRRVLLLGDELVIRCTVCCSNFSL